MNLNRDSQQGSMLISVLFIMVVLALLMAAMVTVSNQSSQQLVYEVQALKARLAAESVLEQQIYAQLDDIKADEVYSSNNKFENHGCDAYIQALEKSASQVKIIATGECATHQLTVIRNIEVEVLSNEN
ncbi:hypothetical protein [Oceanisphaera avium]|uniref:MSHA biogenesis protein MshP n=1 Tax=Oceanisphaera avium TaxID=1903694 RepID=A0A1Y0CV82_9GAMM|nr:hypothetical protein [Oceanisphaera avium]ART79250.1 hypothetical protein CBP12_03055 [Oceanisphaera avium]